MEEEKKIEEKPAEEKVEKKTEKEENKIAEQPKTEEKKEEIKEETKEKKEEKTKEKKTEKKSEKKVKRTEAVVYGKDLPISTKHCIAICNFIKGKKIDEAVHLLGEVLTMKKAVPMKGEIPHRKGRIMSGRYPINAIKGFVKLLKQLAANATVNELELEKVKIECKADRASRPYRRFGNKRFKRTHVMLKLKINERKKSKQKEKK